MKHSILFASLLALSASVFAAEPASTPVSKAAANKEAVHQYQRNRSAAKALHMRGIHRVVTPRAPTKAASK